MAYSDEENKNIQQEIAELKERLNELEIKVEKINNKYFGEARKYISFKNKEGLIPAGWGQLYDTLRRLTIMAFGYSRQSQMPKEFMEPANYFMIRLVDMYITFRQSLLNAGAIKQED